jgi:hypothetical protein
MSKRKRSTRTSKRRSLRYSKLTERQKATYDRTTNLITDLRRAEGSYPELLKKYHLASRTARKYGDRDLLGGTRGKPVRASKADRRVRNLVFPTPTGDAAIRTRSSRDATMLSDYYNEREKRTVLRTSRQQVRPPRKVCPFCIEGDHILGRRHNPNLIVEVCQFHHVQLTRQLLERATLDDCFRPPFWKKLRWFALVEANDNFVPIRSKFGHRADSDPTMGWNFLTSKQPIWMTGPDVIAAKLIAGKPLKILKAIKVVPHGVQRGLTPVKLYSQIEVDPRRDDLAVKLVELRSAMKSKKPVSKPSTH